MAGGTGLYIDNVVQNLQLAETQTDFALRDRLTALAQEKGNLYLHETLRAVDPEAADAIHPCNIRRVVRALEVFYTTATLLQIRTKTLKRRRAPIIQLC